MKKRSKNFIYIAIAILVSALVVTTMANEKTISFPDVPNNSPYYDSVVYFSSRGIVAGEKDGKFHPEAEMTGKEWGKILSTMGVKIETPTQDDKLTPAGLYASIWATAGIKTYPASEYGYLSDLDAGTTGMLVTDLVQRDNIGHSSVSRGEALRLLHEVAVKKTVKEIPYTLVDFFVVSIGEGCSAESEAEIRTLLKKFPNVQLALLLAYNYKFVVLTDLSLAPGGDSEQLGFEDVGNHIVYLNDSAISQVLIHEVGHAIETCNASYSKTWKLNKEEGTAGVELLGAYAGTNASEYMAEAIRYFIENTDNDIAMKKMKESIPKTYSYLVDEMNQAFFFGRRRFFLCSFLNNLSRTANLWCGFSLQNL